MISRALRNRLNPMFSAAFSHRVYKNFIDGEWVDSKGLQWFDIRDPVTQDIVAKSPQSTEA